MSAFSPHDVNDLTVQRTTLSSSQMASMMPVQRAYWEYGFLVKELPALSPAFRWTEKSPWRALEANEAPVCFPALDYIFSRPLFTASQSCRLLTTQKMRTHPILSFSELSLQFPLHFCTPLTLTEITIIISQEVKNRWQE